MTFINDDAEFGFKTRREADILYTLSQKSYHHLTVCNFVKS